ncbi:MAG: SRPBCC family protein [Rhodoblastus sp.]|nr:SRPBCC family protein [Rhodoblastus sp.]
MASVMKEICVGVSADKAWDAIRDIGALHKRLAPGFVVDTKVENGGAARVVTFINGVVVREPIVALDEERRRLVWTAEGGRTTHYNASAQVVVDDGRVKIVWTADFLPHEARDTIDAAMTAGAAAMKRALSGP